MYFSVRTHSHSKIVKKIFSMSNISRVSATHVSAIPTDRIFDNSHCAILTRVNKHGFVSDFGHVSAIYQNLSACEKLG